MNGNILMRPRIRIIIIIIINIIIIIIIMAIQPFVGPWPLFQFLDPIRSP
jgi:hypothetical protein